MEKFALANFLFIPVSQAGNGGKLFAAAGWLNFISRGTAPLYRDAKKFLRNFLIVFNVDLVDGEAGCEKPKIFSNFFS